MKSFTYFLLFLSISFFNTALTMEEDKPSLLQQLYIPECSFNLDILPRELQLEMSACNKQQLWFEKEQSQHEISLVRSMQTRQNTIASVCLNRDNTHILTTSNNGTAQLWDATTETIIQSFQHNGFVDSVCFNKDNTQILTANYTTTRLWDAITGKLIYSFTYNGLICSACFNEDNSNIFTACDDQMIRIWQQYTDWTINQLLLYKLLFTWLLVQKPNKTIKNTTDFIATIKIDPNNDLATELTAILNTFPVLVQTSIWNKINDIIQKYGVIR